jgi:hypothetical protein
MAWISFVNKTGPQPTTSTISYVYPAPNVVQITLTLI